MSDEDNVGLPLFPQDVNRVLGFRFTTPVQMARTVGLTEEQSHSALDFLCTKGFARAWLGVRCPVCMFVWPGYARGDRIPHMTRCPLCGINSSSASLAYIDVFEFLKEPPQR